MGENLHSNVHTKTSYQLYDRVLTSRPNVSASIAKVPRLQIFLEQWEQHCEEQEYQGGIRVRQWNSRYPDHNMLVLQFE